MTNSLSSIFRLIIARRNLVLWAVVAFFATVGLSGCNDEVFVKEPNSEQPDNPDHPDNPDGPDNPEITDSLVFVGIEYDPESLEVLDTPIEDQTSSTFTNYSASGNVSVLFDNYNNSIVRFYNSTYYVTPWAQNNETVEIPGLNDELVPAFYGQSVVFKFGTQSLPRQYMAGHRESKFLPNNSTVIASITITRHVVRASGTIFYRNSDTITSSLSQSPITVEVWVPVDIKVEWSDVIPAQ